MTIAFPDPVQPQYIWHSCDLKTGRRQEVLPLVGNPSRLMGAVTTVDLSCDLAALGPGVDFWGSTIPRRTMLALERRFPDQDTSDIPWVGVVTTRPERGSSQTARLGAASLEHLLERRFVGTHTYNAATGEDDAAVITALIGDANTEGWNIQLDLSGLTTLRRFRTKAPERRSVLSCLQELSDLTGGPEWTMNAGWNGQDVAVRLTARPRLGTASTMPNTQFRWPGNVQSYNQSEDHSTGVGANAVTAVTNGIGTSTPAVTATSATRIAVEGRWEAVTQRPAARTAADLAASAAADLAMMLDGQSLYTLTADATRAPRFAIDWILGDDVALVVEAGALDPAGSPSYGHPNGLNIIARAIGWTLDIQQDLIMPVLWQPSEGAA